MPELLQASLKVQAFPSLQAAPADFNWYWQVPLEQTPVGS
jgi:hypothetical protein